MENKLKKIFSKNLVTISSDKTVHEADHVMKIRRIRHLPVVDKGGYLVGMIARSDYAALIHLDIDLKSIVVSALMSSPVKTFSVNAPVTTVAQVFVTEKINSALVMDNHEIVGIVTSQDLLRLLAETNDLEHEMDRMDIGALASEGWISATSLR